MGWSPLGTQFCLELAFGVLLALAFVPKAPVGVLFYRVMGTTALLPAAVALVAAWTSGQIGPSSPATWGMALVVLAYPFYSGPVRGMRWAGALGLAALGCAVALVDVLSGVGIPAGTGGLALASATALATGPVAGGVGLAMVLGHWYLTVPNLAVSHLRRLNRVTVVSMVVCLALVALSCFIFRHNEDERGMMLFGATGLFYLSARIAVGILVPLLFAWMAASSLRYENTRSATGILYASTVLVLIGAAVSVALQDSWGVPL